MYDIPGPRLTAPILAPASSLPAVDTVPKALFLIALPQFPYCVAISTLTINSLCGGAKWQKNSTLIPKGKHNDTDMVRAGKRNVTSMTLRIA